MLLIDDDVDSLNLTRAKLLSEVGGECLVATDYNDSIRLIKDNKDLDLIISDYFLEGQWRTDT